MALSGIGAQNRRVAALVCGEVLSTTQAGHHRTGVQGLAQNSARKRAISSQRLAHQANAQCMVQY